MIPNDGQLPLFVTSQKKVIAGLLAVRGGFWSKVGDNPLIYGFNSLFNFSPPQSSEYISEPKLWHTMSCYGQRLAAVLQGKVKKMCDWWNIRALTRPQAQCLIAVAFSSKSCLQGALWVDLEKMKMKRRRECEVEKEGRLHRLALRGESRIKLIDSDCWMDWSSPRKYNPLQSSVATRVNIPQQYVHSRRSMYTWYVIHTPPTPCSI